MAILYVVATPLGHLEDLTFRSLEVLNQVDLILSEDTRETDKILKKHAIKTPQISYREENHNRVLPKIMERFIKGQKLALLSDNGTPVISDPGFLLLREIYNYNSQFKTSTKPLETPALDENSKIESNSGVNP